MVRNIFLIIGISGAGKTTCAKLVSNNNKISHYSLGSIFRNEIKKKSIIGDKIKKSLLDKNIVSIEIAIDCIIDIIKKSKTDILIDGYPRDIEQMMALDKYLKNINNIKLLHVFEIKADVNVAKKRIINRSRDIYDEDSTFSKKINHHMKHISVIRKFYQKKKIFSSICGDRTISEIAKDINLIIQSSKT